MRPTSVALYCHSGVFIRKKDWIVLSELGPGWNSRILSGGCVSLAPTNSAMNAQPWRFVAVDDPAVLDELRAALERRIDEIAHWPEVEAAGLSKDAGRMRGYSTFFSDAPVAVAVFGLPYESLADRLLALHGVPRDECDRLRQRPDLQSVGAAVQLLLTAAHVLGYGACWLSAPVIAAPQLEELLGVTAPEQLVAIVAVGVPVAEVRGTKRLPVDDVLRFVPAEPAQPSEPASSDEPAPRVESAGQAESSGAADPVAPRES